MENKPHPTETLTPALIEDRFPGLRTLPWQVIADAVEAFACFSAREVGHLRDNTDRLVRCVYRDAGGHGCIFNLLSELSGPDGWIDSREKLTRYFTGGCGPDFRERPEYQPARWLVRVWDRQPLARYGQWTGLTAAMVRDLCELSLQLRQLSGTAPDTTAAAESSARRLSAVAAAH